MPHQQFNNYFSYQQNIVLIVVWLAYIAIDFSSHPSKNSLADSLFKEITQTKDIK